MLSGIRMKPSRIWMFWQRNIIYSRESQWTILVQRISLFIFSGLNEFMCACFAIAPLSYPIIVVLDLIPLFWMVDICE